MPSRQEQGLAGRYAPGEHNRVIPAFALAFVAGVWLAPRVTVGAWPLWLIAVAALGGLALWLRRKPLCFAALPLALMAALLLTQHALYPVAPQAGKVERITATVYGEPAQRSNGRVAFTLCDVRLNGIAQLGKAYCTLYEDSGIPADALFDGAALTFQGSVYRPAGKSNAYDFDFRLWLLQNGMSFGISGVEALTVSNTRADAPWTDVASRIRGLCQTRLQQLMGDESSLAMAMLLGSRDGLAEEEQLSFQRAGVAHLMSVSGLHVALLAGALGWLLNLLALRKAVRLPVLMVCIVLYCALTGFSPAAVRATVMLLLYLTGQAMGRKTDLLTLLSAAAIIVLVLNPLDLFSVGFLLSFSAMAGILVLNPLLTAVCKRGGKRTERGRRRNALVKLLEKPGDLLCVSLAAQTGAALPTAAFFHQLPLYGVVFNLVAVPLAGILVPLYALTLTVSLLPAIGGALGAALGFAAKWGSALMLGIVKLSNGLPFAQIRVPSPSLWVYLGLAGGMLAVSRFVRASVPKRALAIAVAACVAVVGAFATRPATLRYHQFAVGQGDASLIVDGRATVAVDVGAYGGEVSQRLLAEGRDLDALILTHLHNDHAQGVATLLTEGIAIRDAYLPYTAEDTAPEDEGGATLALLKEKGVPIHYLAAGDRLDFEQASIEVLWPQAGRARAGREVNDVSLVTLVRLGGVRVLSMADVSGQYERYAAVVCDVLKVGHHGSGSGTTDAFLASVAPKVALVTCKADALLPAKATLDRLTARGVKVLRTDVTGEIMLEPTAGGYRVCTYHSDASE